MLYKKEQTRKKKIREEKKLQKNEFKSYRNWLWETFTSCQAKLDNCNGDVVDAHHVLFGCYGAYKDDTLQICICRNCHEWAHKNKALSQELFLHVARENWKQYGGSEDIDNG